MSMKRLLMKTFEKKKREKEQVYGLAVANFNHTRHTTRNVLTVPDDGGIDVPNRCHKAIRRSSLEKPAVWSYQYYAAHNSYTHIHIHTYHFFSVLTRIQSCNAVFKNKKQKTHSVATQGPTK
jgi:hypothetical protein